MTGIGGKLGRLAALAILLASAGAMAQEAGLKVELGPKGLALLRYGPADLIGDRSAYLTPNITLDVTFVEGKPVLADLPNTVELTITETPPEVKGATVTSQLKDAVCEGGARVKVPAFVVTGMKIRVDTRTGEYLGRV